MALKGIKVLEFAGLVPGPFCGMILADFGASVTRIDRLKAFDVDVLGNGKKSIALNLKKPESVSIIKKLAQRSDVVIDPYRPGVLEKLGLGPADLCGDNPRLIYSRLTGYGDHGYYANRAGHDINYLAISGLLSILGRKGEKPSFPINFAADLAGGGFLCAMGIVMALFERSISGKGQVIDANMTEGTAYVASWLSRAQDTLLFTNPRGENFLDSGAHFYDVYETKDGRYVAVGAIEPQFYEALLEGVGLTIEQMPYLEFENGRKMLTEKFLEKTQEQWSQIFDEKDACVTPVLDYEQVATHPHNKQRRSFIIKDNVAIPVPAPRMSRTPGETTGIQETIQNGGNTVEVLLELGYQINDIRQMNSDGVIAIADAKL